MTARKQTKTIVSQIDSLYSELSTPDKTRLNQLKRAFESQNGRKSARESIPFEWAQALLDASRLAIDFSPLLGRNLHPGKTRLQVFAAEHAGIEDILFLAQSIVADDTIAAVVGDRLQRSPAAVEKWRQFKHSPPIELLDVLADLKVIKPHLIPITNRGAAWLGRWVFRHATLADYFGLRTQLLAYLRPSPIFVPGKHLSFLKNRCGKSGPSWPIFTVAIHDVDASDLKGLLNSLTLRLQSDFHVVWADCSTRLTNDPFHGKGPIPARSPSIHAVVTSRKSTKSDSETRSLLLLLEEICRESCEKKLQSRDSAQHNRIAVIQAHTWSRIHPVTNSWHLRYPKSGSPLGTGIYGTVPKTGKPIAQLLEHLAEPLTDS